MTTSRWLAVIFLLFILFLGWELNRTDTLGQALWTGYVVLSVMAFTSAWLGLTCCAVIWVYRLARRGHEEEGLDLIASAQKRMMKIG